MKYLVYFTSKITGEPVLWERTRSHDKAVALIAILANAEYTAWMVEVKEENNAHSS